MNSILAVSIISILFQLASLAGIPGIGEVEVNGRPLTSIEDKLSFLGYSSIPIFISLIALFLTKANTLKKSALAWRFSHWLEGLVNESKDVGIICVLIIIGINIVIILTTPNLGGSSRLIAIVMMPITFIICFIAAIVQLFVFGIFGKAISRYFALVFIALFGFGAIAIMPFMYYSVPEASGELALPTGLIGVVVGSTYALNRWIGFNSYLKGETPNKSLQPTGVDPF